MNSNTLVGLVLKNPEIHAPTSTIIALPERREQEQER
jgi:hypothetical protein